MARTQIIDNQNAGMGMKQNKLSFIADGNAK